ncbi:hypothetical protein GGS20DRAFT_489799 [Poronia punctata]|nr:hypothetical protein GGS20DRAFT_489799 [Poronia punctata]
MSSPIVTNNLFRATTRSVPRVSQPLKRTYATERPNFPGSGNINNNNNRNLLIGASVGLPALAYFMIPSPKPEPAISVSSESETTMTPSSSTTSPPATPKKQQLSGQANRSHNRKKAEEEDEHGGPRYLHPEMRDPDKYKPPFGQLHAKKRVDGPPDGRNHQNMSDRQRQW